RGAVSEAWPLAEEALGARGAEVVDAFRLRRQRGENPCVEAYAARYPHAAADIRRVLAALDLLELPGACDPAPAGGSAEAAALGGTLGDFRIRREIGRVGMGIVHYAHHLSLRRPS